MLNGKHYKDASYLENTIEVTQLFCLFFCKILLLYESVSTMFRKIRKKKDPLMISSPEEIQFNNFGV